MNEKREDEVGARSVTRSEFLSDAEGVMRRAETEGPIVVTDDEGSPRMAIHCPREKLPTSID